MNKSDYEAIAEIIRHILGGSNVYHAFVDTMVNYKILENTLFNRIKGPDVSLKTRNKKIKNYQDAKKRDEAKTNIPMKTNGPSMEQNFKEKTIAKVKDMISKAKEKEKLK